MHFPKLTLSGLVANGGGVRGVSLGGMEGRRKRALPIRVHISQTPVLSLRAPGGRTGFAAVPRVAATVAVAVTLTGPPRLLQGGALF